MKPGDRIQPASRRAFLKKLGSVLLAGAAVGRLAGALAPQPRPVAKAATGGEPRAHAVSTDWNELSDPGWSG
jgi:hypothetical protein